MDDSDPDDILRSLNHVENKDDEDDVKKEE